MSDITVLKAMLDYGLYVKYSPTLFKLDNLEQEHQLILNSTREYYEKYKDKKSITVDELETFFYYSNPMSPKETYERLFSQLRDTVIDNPALVKDVLNQVVWTHTCSKLAYMGHSVVQNQTKEGPEEFKQLLHDYDEIVGTMIDPYEQVCTASLDELLDMDEEGGINWGLRFLNSTLGPLKPRTLGHIFARPDGGKTSLALHQICYMAWQLRDMNKKLLYLNNEEDIHIVKRRLYSAMLGWELEQLKAQRGEAKRTFEEKGGDSILLIGGVNNIQEVENHINTIRPHVVIVDQGPKVGFPGAKLNEVERKQRLYNRYRELAKEYELIFISLGQADNASENKRYIGLGNLDGSKVGIPGELDWALGIGKLTDPGYEYTRYLNIAKNKITGLYGQAEVKFDPLSCRYDNL